MRPYKKSIYFGFLFAILHGIVSTLPILIAARGLSLVLYDHSGVQALSGNNIIIVSLLMLASVLGKYLFAYLRAVTKESVRYEQTADERIRIGEILRRVSLGFSVKTISGN